MKWNWKRETVIPNFTNSSLKTGLLQYEGILLKGVQFQTKQNLSVRLRFKKKWKPYCWFWNWIAFGATGLWKVKMNHHYIL